MKSLRTLILWIVLLALLALLSWAVTLYADWPLWAAAAIFFGVLGSYLLMRFVRRLFLLLRSRSLAAREDLRARADSRRVAPETLLRRKWEAAVATLRASSLRRQGNPLHVLPWYMVIGRSGSGKTSALTRSRMASPLQKVRQGAAIEQTVNCDWWYFEKAVVLDCAGRYVDPQDIEQDRKEWELGLDLLARYRAREGINGLVLVVNAERLTQPDRDALAEEANVIRERIDQLIRLFGKRFPIYVLVTKCDRLYGFESWIKSLPADRMNQAMGYLAHEPADGQTDTHFIHDAFDSILARLKTLRLLLVGKHPDAASQLLLFPREIEQLKDGLNYFVQACLGQNPYLESPFLRGLFFSSARQEGGARSSVLREQIPPEPAHPDTHAGMFLHDLFGSILPRDRDIALPATQRSRWRSMTQNMGTIAWLMLASAIAILMTLGLVRNVNTLNSVRQEYPLDPQFVGDLPRDAATLHGISQALAMLEQRGEHPLSNWTIGSSNMRDLEAQLKKSYQDKYKRYIVPATEGNFHTEVRQLLESDPDNRLPLLTLSQIRYVNLIGARIRGADRDELAAMPRIPLDGTQPQGSSAAQLHERLVDLFISHLAWLPSTDPFLAERLATEQAALARMAYRDPPLAWVPALLPITNPELRPVSLDEFWTSKPTAAARPLKDAPTVPAAFTRPGLRQIDAILAEMETSTPDGPRFLRLRAAFKQELLAQRFMAWRNFVSRFPEGERLLAGEADWRSLLGNITGNRSPYFRLIDRLVEEFDDVEPAVLPEWLKQAREFSRLRREEAATQSAGQATKLFGAINVAGGNALRQTLSSGMLQGEQAVRDHLNAQRVLREYLDAINEAATEAAGGPGKAYQAAADLYAFGVDPTAEKPSPLRTAADKLEELRKLSGSSSPDKEELWRLISGPLHFTTTYVGQQTSCSLQGDWDSQVLWPLQTITSTEEAVNNLYGENGSVWAFVEGTAKPFLSRNANRFSIRSALAGYSVPFTEPLLPALNAAVGKRVEQLVAQQQEELRKQQTQQRAAQAELQKQQDKLAAQQKQTEAEAALAAVRQQLAAGKTEAFPLTINAQPTGVNPAARAKPFLTGLAVQCAAGARKLLNYNFPVSDSFTWSPAQCGEVALEIHIDQLTLTKKYPGPNGMVRFLQDFRDGRRQFTPDEFPAARARLQELGVHQLAVRFDFQGQDAILQHAAQMERLAQAEKDKNVALQQAQQAVISQEQQILQAKLDGMVPVAAPAAMPSAFLPLKQVALPQRIGVCWNASVRAHHTQTLQEMFREAATPPLQTSAVPSGAGPVSAHPVATSVPHPGR